MKLSIAKIAKKKTLIPVIIIILAFGSWFFLFLYHQKTLTEEKYNDTVVWSSEEDYEIRKISGETFVFNEKVGLNFRVPDKWTVGIENQQEDSQTEYWINILNSAATFDENNILRSGCGIGCWVEFQEDTSYIKNNIELIREYPEQFPGEEIIEVDGYSARKQFSEAEDPRLAEILGESVLLQIPIEDGKVINFDGRFFPEHKEKCFEEFDNLIKTILIE